MKVEPEVTECVEDLLDSVCAGGPGMIGGQTLSDDEHVISLLMNEMTERVEMEEEVLSMCMDAMRLTVKRFFNHYKAYYRLARAYMHNPTPEVS